MACGDQPALTCELVSAAALVRLRGADLETGVIDREVGSPFTNADLIRRMADHIAGNALAGASMAWYSGRFR